MALATIILAGSAACGRHGEGLPFHSGSAPDHALPFGASTPMQQWLDDVRRAATSATEASAVYPLLLRTLSDRTHSHGAVAWDCSALPFHVICSYQRDPNLSVELGLNEQQHLALLEKTASASDSVLTFRPDGEGADDTHALIAMRRIERNGRHEIVELFLPSGQSDQQYRAQLEQLDQACRAMADAWNGAQQVSLPAQDEPADQTIAEQPAPCIELASLDRYVDEVHGTIQFTDTCFRLANATQRLLGCDRVSVVRMSGNQCRLVAVSGQSSINRRSNSVKHLERLAARALAVGQLFWYPEEDSSAPPQIERPLSDYLVQSATRSLVIVPLTDRVEADSTRDDAATVQPPRVVGGLILEHLSRQLNPAQWRQPVEALSLHAASAYRNAYAHRSLFLYPLWHFLGKSKVVVQARHLPKTIAVAVGALLLLAILLFWPTRFTVSSKGVLLPTLRANVFTAVDGQIVDVPARHGMLVRAGQPLVHMSSTELDLQMEDVSGRIELLSESRQAIDTHLLDMPEDDQTQRLKLERASLIKELQSLRSQLAILQEQQQKLTVTSPIDGQIITWNVDEKLEDRPVLRGRILMEVADVDGPWQLELNMPDRRIGHVLRAQQSSKQPLRVSFILAADPNRRFTGRITDISRGTEVDSEDGQTIRVSVEFDSSQIDIRQVRTDVQAKIHCGRASLGYVWLHDVFEFFDRQVIFWLW